MKLELCRVRHAIMVGGEPHRLPDLSFRLLDLLVSRAPDPITFAEIEQTVWNAQVTRETIKQRVTMLRESLEQIGIDGAAIEAVRNHGYRTTLQESVAEPAHASPPRRWTAWAAGIVLFLAAAGVLAWQFRDSDTVSKPVVAVALASPAPGSDAAQAEALRREVVRAISKFEGVQVTDRAPPPGEAPIFLVRLSLEAPGGDRKLATELVDGATGAVLFAERYAVSPAVAERAVLHFANNVHAHVSAFSPSSGKVPDDTRTRYAEAYRLWRLGDRQSLLGARKSLAAMADEPEATLIARSLRARVTADLVMRHGEPAALARQAELDIRALIATRPGVGDLRYSLARTLLAQGKRDEALDELRIAQQTMPFLARDILAIESSSEVPSGTVTD
jgi:DNA-binding winged helix-turn-helix (wHTH) protein